MGRRGEGFGREPGVTGMADHPPNAAPDVPDHAPLCAPPDRHPRLPRNPLPRGACDCHAHIFGPAAEFAYAAERIYTPPDCTWTDYRHLLDTLGLERAVLVQPSVYGTDNAAMLAALAVAGPGVRAVAVVGENVSADELASLNGAGVRGVRFNLVDRRDARNAVPKELLRSIALRIAPLGWHIELLINLDQAAAFTSSLDDIPVPIVIGHMGYPREGAPSWIDSPGFSDLLRLLDGGQYWVKLTGPYRISARELPYDDVDAVARKLIAVAGERMLWGTDWPHVMVKTRMPNDGDLADLIERWAPDAAARSRILIDNPAALYGFVPGERIGD
jgi:predicted TIM-barrel fold metal-dependent hydrolase